MADHIYFDDERERDLLEALKTNDMFTLWKKYCLDTDPIESTLKEAYNFASNKLCILLGIRNNETNESIEFPLKQWITSNDLISITILPQETFLFNTPLLLNTDKLKISSSLTCTLLLVEIENTAEDILKNILWLNSIIIYDEERSIITRFFYHGLFKIYEKDQFLASYELGPLFTVSENFFYQLPSISQLKCLFQPLLK